VKGVKIGNSLGPDLVDYQGPSMGPVVSRGQYEKIWAYIDEAKAAGVKVLYGGERSIVKVSICDV
jgi:acyl-CoA reductase-like NAD-dependent aldehyde dehydrogenase